MKLDRMLQLFARSIRELKVEGRRWIVGFSGGLDSTVLLDLALRYREGIAPNQEIVALHIHHGLRGEEADRDAEHCRAFCEKRGVLFSLEKVDVRRIAEERGWGLEEAGRKARHRIFARYTHSRAFFQGTQLLSEEVQGAEREEKKGVILLAHHADDQAETFLLHLLRGAGLRGLRGMAQREDFEGEEGVYTVVRPLLTFSRERLRRYAEGRTLLWREDASNFDTTFLRNRIRHELLPLLESMRRGAARRLAKTALHLRQAYAAIELEAQAYRESHEERREDGFFLGLNRRGFPPEAILLEAIREIAEDNLGAGPRAERWDAVLRLVREGVPGTMIELPGGVRIFREREGLRVVQLPKV